MHQFLASSNVHAEFAILDEYQNIFYKRLNDVGLPKQAKQSLELDGDTLVFKFREFCARAKPKTVRKTNGSGYILEYDFLVQIDAVSTADSPTFVSIFRFYLSPDGFIKRDSSLVNTLYESGDENVCLNLLSSLVEGILQSDIFKPADYNYSR